MPPKTVSRTWDRPTNAYGPANASPRVNPGSWVPEVEWPGTGLTYVGYESDGRQVRIRYFEEAALWGRGNDRGVGSPGEDIRIALLDDVDSVTADDVVAVWRSHAGMPEAEARRRTSEIFAVATDTDGALVGVCTVYLQHRPELRAELWHYRVFIVPGLRMEAVGSGLGRFTFETLERRFVTGEDQRGRGIVMVMENPEIRAINPRARWRAPGFDFMYVGENQLGHHVRLRWFPGALAPPPPA